MTKVWLLNYVAYGDVSVYEKDTDILNVLPIKDELSLLVEGYADEREEFIADVVSAINRGRGTAEIEERLVLELVEVQ